MSLFSRYNLILRIIIRLAADFNWIWQFVSVKSWIRILLGNKSVGKGILRTKLQSLLGCNELELASPEIIQEVTGAKVGFAGPVNLKKQIKILADYAVGNIVNAVIGANKDDKHIKNVNINRDFKADITADIRTVLKGDICPRCKNE